MTSENPSTRTFTDAARRSTGSFELVLGPVLMALLGLVVDRWLGTAPLFILLFTLWGVIGAGVSLFYRYRTQVASVQVARDDAGGES
ncbi:MAG: AtpZ/AtpI family protein [Actinomycetia bacterium]|nr:AtpZ/AtpI family protein [Actinomycetes bacterium]